MNYQQALEYLNSLEGRGIKLGLDNMKEVVTKLGNPQDKYKVIHVAGTNGKGSVCAMLSAILKKAGYKVGLYTSPHLVRINERIKINDKEISNKDLAELVDKAKKITDKLTYFEFLTLMAFLFFKEKKVDYAVIEVGLGGRLDATNIVNSQISAITSIGLEHTKQLGDNIRSIAGEKAAIIKPNSIVVTCENGDALDVIRAECLKKNSRVIISRDSEFESSLKGKFQKKNIGMAVEVAKSLGIKEEDIKQGLMNAIWPGRLQSLKHNLLVDCAHNPSGIEVLVNELKDIPYRRLILVIGILADKEYKSMLKLITPLSSKVIIVKAKIDRALEPEIIAKEITKDYEIIDDAKEAVESALKLAQKNDLVLVTGSIYVVGEVLEKFFK